MRISRGVLALGLVAMLIAPAAAHAQIIKAVAGNPWYEYRVPVNTGTSWVAVHDTLIAGEWAVAYTHKNNIEYQGSARRQVCSTPDEKPTFSLSYIIPTTALQDGTRIRYRAYSCSRFPGRIDTADGDAIVTSGSAARDQHAEEPAWVVSGSGARPFVAWIARSDMRVLRLSEK